MAIFMFIMGVLFVISATWLLIYNKFVFIKKAVVVKGTVVDFSSRRMSNGGKTYKPIIEYTDPFTDQIERFDSNIGRPSKKSLGKVKDIYLYKKDNGKMRREEKSRFNQYIGPSIFLVIGILLAFFNAIYLF